MVDPESREKSEQESEEEFPTVNVYVDPRNAKWRKTKSELFYPDISSKRKEDSTEVKSNEPECPVPQHQQVDTASTSGAAAKEYPDSNASIGDDHATAAKRRKLVRHVNYRSHGATRGIDSDIYLDYTSDTELVSSLDSLSTVRNRLAAGVRDEVFPLRVINVRDTLASKGGVCFSKPKDWNFHTLSHTWSKMVRDWSEEVGRLKVGSGEDYDAAFKHQDFSLWPCYDRFLELLQILQTDGVEDVWFDALCIDQTDNDEKSREIEHMGAFYCCSLGCYVLAHGLGEGFGVLSKEGNPARWFSRVWTLQECVIPEHLTFIVELDAASSKKACRYLDEDGRIRDEVVKDVMDESDIFFRRSAALITTANIDPDKGRFKGVAGHETLYFVDKISYGRLALLLCNSEELQSSIERLHLMLGRPPGVTLGEIPRLPRHAWHVSIVREIARRSFSEGHEEDRVLSILGLLEVEGRVKALRVGKTLDEQILAACQALNEVGNEELLLALCGSFVEPYPSARMSWAPHFSPSQWKVSFMDSLSNAPFVGKAGDTHILDVSEEGLRLSCRFLKACILPFEKHKEGCMHKSRGSECYSCLQGNNGSYAVMEIILEAPSAAASSPLTFPFHLRLNIAHDHHLSLELTSCVIHPGLDGGFLCELLLPLQDSTFTPSSAKALAFPTWLLLIAFKEDDDPSLHERAMFSCTFLFMVCVDTPHSGLHKIGLLEVKTTHLSKWQGFSPSYHQLFNPVSEFLVAGSGTIPLRELLESEQGLQPLGV